jgi:hypothetical protein
VLDSTGLVVGIVCSTLEGGQLLNFAIPSTLVRNVVISAPQKLNTLTQHGPSEHADRDSNTTKVTADRLLRRIVGERTLALLDEEDQKDRDNNMLASNEALRAAYLRRAERRARIRNDARELCGSSHIELHSLLPEFGWPEDRAWRDLTLFLQLKLSDDDKRALLEAATALTCSMQDSADAWRLLAVISGLEFFSDVGRRALFEIARLDRDSSRARYGFLLQYYVDGRVCTPLPDCPSDWVRVSVAAVLSGEQHPDRDPLAILYELTEPSSCRTLLRSMAGREPDWLSVPEFCQVLSHTDFRKATWIVAQAELSETDRSAIDLVHYAAEDLEQRMSAYLDVDTRLLRSYSSVASDLTESLEMLTNCIRLTTLKRKAESDRGMFVGPENSGMYAQCAQLQYLLGDVPGAILSQRKVVEIADGILRANVGSYPGKEDWTSLNTLLVSWRARVEAEGVLARLQYRGGDAEAGRATASRVDALVKNVGEVLRENDRNAPAFQHTAEEIARVVAKVKAETGGAPSNGGAVEGKEK